MTTDNEHTLGLWMTACGRMTAGLSSNSLDEEAMMVFRCHQVSADTSLSQDHEALSSRGKARNTREKAREIGETTHLLRAHGL